MAQRRVRGNRTIKNGVWFRTFGPVKTVPCHWCGSPLTFNDATFDHEPPLSMPGGSRLVGVISCRPCNQARGTETNAELGKMRAVAAAHVLRMAGRPMTAYEIADRAVDLCLCETTDRRKLANCLAEAMNLDRRTFARDDCVWLLRAGGDPGGVS